MKKKLIFIIGGIVLLMGIGITCFFVFDKNDDTEEEIEVKKDCLTFTGGGFTVKLDKNNGEDTEEYFVCIACAPDSYDKIEEPTKEGYTFAGWYYDSDYKEKAEVETTLDITPVQEKDKDGCVIGYKEVTLYARWEKEN